MKTVTACLGLSLISGFLLTSCQKPEKLSSEEMRELTTLDARPVPTAPTSKDRFEPPASMVAESTTEHTHGEAAPTGGFTHTADPSWEAQPPTQFRTINYKLPEGGELYVTLSGGGILPNINRWYGQFGAEKISGEDLATLPRVQILGTNGYIAEATGSYAGMGRAEQSNMSLLGALAQVGDDLVTVKMISTPEEVTQQRAAFISFCESLTSQ